MRVFVATAALDEVGEFSFAIPGELVHFPPITCDCPDCGCERSMVGFTSQKATTCFVSREFDLDLEAYSNLLYDSLVQSGWITEGLLADRTWVEDWALEHMAKAISLPFETPLEARGDRVLVRREGSTAD